MGASSRKSSSPLRFIVALLVVAALAVGAWFAYGAISEDLREQAALSVRNSILNSAKQCCAIEGAYPSSLSYLEENYGLSINHKDYLIVYEAFAENIMPSVAVSPR